MASRLEIGKRLTAIQEELSSLHGELAEVRKAERQAYSQGYFGSGESTGEARKHQGQLNSLNLKVDELDLLGRIESLVEERDHLRFVVKYNMEAAIA